jgi:hypothetical protein
MVLLEISARSLWAERAFPIRSLGIYHYPFELKWFQLREYVQKYGGVDAILIGSSLVNTGVDPEVMSQAFFERTGTRLRIFNFGVEGLTVAPNAAIADLLIKEFHPDHLIYVTDMRDFIATVGVQDEKRFLSNPWLQYKAGRINLSGWLIDHRPCSISALPEWMRADFPESFYAYLRASWNTSEGGYEPEYAVAENLDTPPNPDNPADARYFTSYGNYLIDPARLADMVSILELGQTRGTRILVAEMPVHPTFFSYVGGNEIHVQFQETISSAVISAGGTFSPAEACENIPDSGRGDRWHLNVRGAPVFSACLGGNLADLAAEVISQSAVPSVDNRTKSSPLFCPFCLRRPACVLAFASAAAKLVAFAGIHRIYCYLVLGIGGYATGTGRNELLPGTLARPCPKPAAHPALVGDTLQHLHPARP